MSKIENLRNVKLITYYQVEDLVYKEIKTRVNWDYITLTGQNIHRPISNTIYNIVFKSIDATIFSNYI